MKPKYTFLLSLTFLFLFSGSVYGGVIDETIDNVFDRKGEVVLSCYIEKRGHYSYIVLNRKDKVIRYLVNDGEGYQTFEIVKENEVFIKGIHKRSKDILFITKHIYKEHIQIIWERTDYYRDSTPYEKKSNHNCSIGNKKF
jgi:hypothetical protein